MKVFHIVFFIVFLLIISFLISLQIHHRKEKQQKKHDKLHVVIVATDANRTDQLLASLSTKNGYKVHVKGLGEHWTGYDFKLRHTLSVAKKLKPDEILMHLDAYDTYVLTNADEIIKKFIKMDANIVVSTETNLAPNHEFQKEDMKKLMEQVYPTTPSRFRWINSGTYIGYAGAIVNILSSMPPNFYCDMPTGEKIDSSDDQRCFHTVFLKEREKHNMKLDYNQDIFHCMWGVDQYSLEPKRIHSETGSMPCIIHGNGRAPSFDQVVQKLKS